MNIHLTVLHVAGQIDDAKVGVGTRPTRRRLLPAVVKACPPRSLLCQSRQSTRFRQGREKQTGPVEGSLDEFPRRDWLPAVLDAAPRALSADERLGIVDLVVAVGGAGARLRRDEGDLGKLLVEPARATTTNKLRD